MDETNEGIPIPDDVQTTVDGRDSWTNPCQMMHKTNVYGWDQWRTANTRWCTDQLLMDKTDDSFHTRWCTKQLLIDNTSEGLHIPEDVQKNNWWMRQNKESIPDDVRNNCRWMRLTRDYPCHMMYTQLLIDKTDERIHARWCTKQLFMDEASEGIPVPDDVQYNCWWKTQMKESMPDAVRNNCWSMSAMKRVHIPHYAQNNCWWMRENNGSTPDNVRNNCWWMRSMKDCSYQMMYKTTVDARHRWRNPCQMRNEATGYGRDRWWNTYRIMHERTDDGWDQWRTIDTSRCAKERLMYATE